MMNKNDTVSEDTDLAGFEAPEDEFDPSVESGEQPHDDAVDDADFQDVSDDVDADVFGEVPPAEAPAKKKINWFNIGVAVVATAVAGGLIWNKLGPQLMGSGMPGMGEPAAIAAAADPASMQTQSQAAVQAAVSAPAPEQQSAGLLDNPDQFSNLGQMPAPAPADAQAQQPAADPFAALGSAVPAVPVASATAPVAGQPPVDAASVPMPAPISGAPVPEQPLAPQTTDIQTTDIQPADMAQAVVPAPSVETLPSEIVMPAVDGAAPAPASAVPVAAVGSAAVALAPQNAGQGDATIKAQVDALEQKLQALDTKVTQAVEKLSVMGEGGPSSVDDVRFSSIQSALERLEDRLNAMSSAPAAKKAQVDADAPEVIVVPKTATKKKAQKSSSSASKKASSSWDEPYSPSAPVSKKAKAQSATSDGGWQLRGAQTGRAIIAKGGNMREVGVGETVPGLGEITGIASVNGRWVVQGTQGRIAQ